MYSKLLEDISGAIGARLLVQFSYRGDTYLVEPHLVGKNKANQDCLYGWVSGDTAPPQTGWDFFMLEDISNFKIMEERFSKARPGYDPYDNNMNRIYYRF